MVPESPALGWAAKGTTRSAKAKEILLAWSLSSLFPKEKTDEEFRAEQDRQSRRRGSEVKARNLAWAEHIAEQSPDSRLAQGILEAARRDL